jgi:hypothetical protein
MDVEMLSIAVCLIVIRNVAAVLWLSARRASTKQDFGMGTSHRYLS